MRPLFACWSEVLSRFASHRVIALFLDFDGTLVAIQPHPDAVHMNAEARRTLAVLARSPRFRVWVISARRRADVSRRMGVPGIRYLGLYGWERAPIHARPAGPVTHVKTFLTGSLPAHPNIWIEDKQHTIAVHYRGAPETVRGTALERVQRAVAPWRPGLRIAPGKAVWEILPTKFGNKGAAVRRELAALPAHALPVYLGDDLSDEDAFAALPHGVSIRVGTRRNTRARYHLESVGQVHGFLEKLRREIL
jgi:trehalose 6-phosphate phosphatase